MVHAMVPGQLRRRFNTLYQSHLIWIGMRRDRQRLSARIAEFAGEPRLREGPVGCDGRLRAFENQGCLLQGEASEVAEFDDAGLARVKGGELLQGVLKSKEIDFAPRVIAREIIVERRATPLSTALVGVRPPGVIDEDEPDRVGGDAEKVRASLPVEAALVDESEERLVDEGGRLQGVSDALLAHAPRCDCPQLVVNERQEIPRRTAVAAVDRLENLRRVLRIGRGWIVPVVAHVRIVIHRSDEGVLKAPPLDSIGSMDPCRTT
jgi:hypothetical protein